MGKCAMCAPVCLSLVEGRRIPPRTLERPDIGALVFVRWPSEDRVPGPRRRTPP
jgi:hypothetical protein